LRAVASGERLPADKMPPELRAECEAGEFVTLFPDGTVGLTPTGLEYVNSEAFCIGSATIEWLESEPVSEWLKEVRSMGKKETRGER